MAAPLSPECGLPPHAWSDEAVQRLKSHERATGTRLSFRAASSISVEMRRCFRVWWRMALLIIRMHLKSAEALKGRSSLKYSAFTTQRAEPDKRSGSISDVYVGSLQGLGLEPQASESRRVLCCE